MGNRRVGAWLEIDYRPQGQLGGDFVSVYYVYALKDPRTSPAKPFYIGKGVGSRTWDHLLTVDKTAKGQRIREIRDCGQEPMVTVLCDELEEVQALRLEAEMISAFGTEATGGLLTNSVIPSGDGGKRKAKITVPLGAPEKAQLGLNLLKDVVLELAQANPDGITNADAANTLGLVSDYDGGSKNYLSYSIMGLLMREGRLKRTDKAKGQVGGLHVAQVR